MEIKVKSKENQDGVLVTYDIPSDIAGLVSKYGEEQTHALASRAIVLAVQALVRQNITDKPANELQALVDAWVPGVKRPAEKKSPLERATAALGQMSADDLAALVAKVKAAQKAAQG